MEKKKTIIIIEDDLVIQDSYKYFIESFDNYVLKGAYETIEEALYEYDSICPDIIISDISLPGTNGIDGIANFKNIDPDVKIIMISLYDDTVVIEDSIKNMADGYLAKPVGKTDFYNALIAIENGVTPMSSNVSKRLNVLLKKIKSNTFTDREKDILKFLTKGVSDEYMAENLSLSIKTLNRDKKNISAKLGGDSNSKIIEMLAKLDEKEIFTNKIK